MYYTRISRKQIGVIYSNAKKGNIQLTDKQIAYMYNHFSEVSGIKNNENQEDVYLRVKACVDALFQNDYETAQNRIDEAFKVECACFSSKEIEELKGERK